METKIETPLEMYRRLRASGKCGQFDDNISSGTFWIRDGKELISQPLTGTDWKTALIEAGFDVNYAELDAWRCGRVCINSFGKPLMDKSGVLTMTHKVIPDSEWDKRDVDVFVLELRLLREEPITLEFRSGGSLGAPSDDRPAAFFVLLSSLIEKDPSGKTVTEVAVQIRKALDSSEEETINDLMRQSQDKKALIPRGIEEYAAKLEAASIERREEQAPSGILDPKLLHKTVLIELENKIFRFNGTEISGTVVEIAESIIGKYVKIATKDGKVFNVFPDNVKSWNII